MFYFQEHKDGRLIDQNTSLLSLAVQVQTMMQKHGILAVLSGGAVTEFYTDGLHRAKDLDFISPATEAELNGAMTELGFRTDGEGRVFRHENCPVSVEFPARRLDLGSRHYIGYEHVEMQTINGHQLLMLSPAQAVCDRLCGYLSGPSNSSGRADLKKALTLACKRKVTVNEILPWLNGATADRREHRFVEKCLRQVERRGRFSAPP